LHMVQLLPLPSLNPIISCLIRLILSFWYWITQIVLEKRPLNGCSSNSSKSKTICHLYAKQNGTETVKVITLKKPLSSIPNPNVLVAINHKVYDYYYYYYNHLTASFP